MFTRFLATVAALSVSVLAAPMAYAAPSPTPKPAVTPATMKAASPAATTTARPTPTQAAAPRASVAPTVTPTPTPTSTPTPTPVHPVDAKYAALGGSAGFLGATTGDLFCFLVDGGCLRTYQGGSIYWSKTTGAHFVRGAIFGVWGQHRWETGKLGYPTTDEICRADGCVQSFKGGQVAFSPKEGTHAVIAPLAGAYEGSTTGPLGYPRGGAYCGLMRNGCLQEFQGGTIYWSEATGARWTRGAIKTHWGKQGWEAGFLGYPTSNEECWIANGCFQRFQGGMIYWNPQAGVHFIRGAIFDKWGRTGWESGHLGYPTSDEQCWIRGGCFQTFQNGSIYWSPATGANFVKGAIFEHWGRNGWEGGHLGYPVSDEFCGLRSGGCGQHFQGGSIYFSPKYGTHFVKGAIKEKWDEYGQVGEFGYPVTDEICGMKGGGCRQVFEGNDHIYFSPATGAHPVFAELMATWGQHGWENGRLGYPVKDPYRHQQNGLDEYGIEFQGGWLYFYASDPGRIHLEWK